MGNYTDLPWEVQAALAQAWRDDLDAQEGYARILQESEEAGWPNGDLPVHVYLDLGF